MTIELTRQMLLDMVKGTGGPGTYTDEFDHVGRLEGFPNERWSWRHDVLLKMSEDQLFNLYNQLRKVP